jgi:predicted AAA+ superfamily ATPase
VDVFAKVCYNYFMANYKKRIVENQISKVLEFAGAVVVEGAKACGKTSTTERIANSAVYLDRDKRLLRAAEDDPGIALKGRSPHLIDEWQLLPDVWNLIRADVDKNNGVRKYLLSGSSKPVDDKTRHSGAGRFVRIRMRSMSSFELGACSGKISLLKLWEGGSIRRITPNPSTEADIAELICKGGWPINLNRSLDEALYLNESYIRQMTSADIVTATGVVHDPNKIEALIYSLARNSASYVSNKTLQQDCENFGASIDIKTLGSYLDALKRIWILDEQYQFGYHVRSSARLRKAPKRHLCDPSLAAAVLGLTPDTIIADRETFGLIFESMCKKDISVYADASGMDIAAYHDYDEEEIDIVVTRKGKWAGMEVKLSSNPDKLEAYAAKLKKVEGKFENKAMFLSIITATGPSYTRKDGVHVINILDLKP